MEDLRAEYGDDESTKSSEELLPSSQYFDHSKAKENTSKRNRLETKKDILTQTGQAAGLPDPDKLQVLFLAASLYEFHADAEIMVDGFPYLTYGCGEVRSPHLCSS